MNAAFSIDLIATASRHVDIFCCGAWQAYARLRYKFATHMQFVFMYIENVFYSHATYFNVALCCATNAINQTLIKF